MKLIKILPVKRNTGAEIHTFLSHRTCCRQDYCTLTLYNFSLVGCAKSKEQTNRRERGREMDKERCRQQRKDPRRFSRCPIWSMHTQRTTFVDICPVKHSFQFRNPFVGLAILKFPQTLS